MRRIFRDAIIGAAAGKLGTAAMTIFMEPGLVGRLSTRWRPAEFVPKQIVRWAEARLGLRGRLSPRQETLVATLAHVGYGATMGSVYGSLRGDRRGMPAPLAGAIWGAVVWAIGYEGWLPALGIRPATTDFPPTRWPVPIGNHVVFGVVTAVAFERLSRSPILTDPGRLPEIDAEGGVGRPARRLAPGRHASR